MLDTSSPQRVRTLRRLLLILLLIGVVAERSVGQTSSGSIIVLLRPGVEHKEGVASVSAALSVGGGSASARQFMVGGGADRSILSLSRLDRYLVVNLNGIDPDGAIARLGSVPSVEFAFANHTYHIDGAPNDSLYAEQWSLQTIGIEEAWGITTGDSNIFVAWVDTGVDPEHPDLAGAFAINHPEDINNNGRFDPWPASQRINGVSGDLDGIDQDANGYTDDVIGYDFVDEVVPNVGDWSGRDPDPFDENGHGTNVGGVIGARRNNRIGIAGVAPNVRLLPLRAFDARGNAEDDDVAAAIVYAVDLGARVVNLSFGDYFSSPLLHDAIRYAWLQRVVVVASSGNEGVNDPHYPSSFPEVISVGATNRSDNVSVFSTYGSQLSLVAPGSEIVTTAPNNRYTTVGGTSFSSPIVAATAALLLSIHPTWGPDEVRSVLELSAKDIGRSGWDIISGAGRLDAAAALRYPGPAVVAIGQPGSDAAFDHGERVTVIGSAIAPFLETWSLEYGSGESPSSWVSISEGNQSGKLNDTLGSFSTEGLFSGVYTLRLHVVQTNGSTTDRRLRLQINYGAPSIVVLDTANVWRFDRRALSVVVGTDQLTWCRLHLRQSGALGTPWRTIDVEPELWGRRRLHQLLLTDLELEAGRPYDGTIEVWNNAGDTLRLGDSSAPLALMLAAEAFPTVGFKPLSYSLPNGYTMNRTAEFYGDGMRCVVLNRFRDNGDFGDLTVYGFDGVSFVLRDSVAEQYAPRDIGDLDGDGRPDLLAQAFGTGIVYSQAVSGGSLFGRTLYQDTTSNDFYASRLYDFTGDGRAEVVARTSNQHDPHFYVAEFVDGGLARIADLPNTSRHGDGESISFLGSPVSSIADFTGNGRPDLLVGDEDGDFLMYEYGSDGTFREIWNNESDGTEGSEFVAAGDVDGDGRPEAIVAWHSRLTAAVGQEYQPKFWDVRIYSFDSDGTSSLLWSDRIAFVRPTNQLRSSIEVADLDGRAGDEVILSFFPNLYILRWDSTTKRIHPFWWKSGTVGNRPIVADFNRDGTNELGIGDGSSIRFYQVQPEAVALESPGGVSAWAINDSTVQLAWLPVVEGESYTIYRARSTTGGGVLFFEGVSSTTATSLVDTGIALPGGRLDSGVFYHYIVTTTRSVPTPTESIRGNPVRAFMHTPARIVRSEVIGSRSFRVAFSYRLRDGLYRPGALAATSKRTGNSIAISTIIASGDSSLVVSLSATTEDTLVVRPTWLLRDADDSPADTSSTTIVALPADEAPGERFIATRAFPRTPTLIVIEFNGTIDVASIALNKFRLSPSLLVIGISRDSTNNRQLLLELDRSTPVGPLGRDYIVRIDSLHAEDGRLLNNGAGSVVGFTVNADDLAGLFVYPQPFSLSRDGSVTFAGLTRVAAVEIYTQSGGPVRRLRATEGNGGVRWDGRDERGELVATGVYVYQVTTSGDDGIPDHSQLNKLVVIP